MFHAAGHLVPTQKPTAVRVFIGALPLPVWSPLVAHYLTSSKAWTFLREFVLGNNKTGLVTNANTPAFGGEYPQYAANTLAEGPEIYQGSYTTTSTYHFPTETVARWDRYIQGASTSGKSLAQTDGAYGRTVGDVVLKTLVSVVVSSSIAFVWFL